MKVSQKDEYIKRLKHIISLECPSYTECDVEGCTVYKYYPSCPSYHRFESDELFEHDEFDLCDNCHKVLCSKHNIGMRECCLCYTRECAECVLFFGSDQSICIECLSICQEQH